MELLKLLNKIKTSIQNVIEYEFADEKGVINKAAGKVFLFLHFVMGFFTIWLTYYQLNMILESNNSPLLWKSGLETLYLVVGVFWGNVGWDYYTNIKNGCKSTEIVDYFLRFLAPGIFVFPIFLSIVQAVVSTFQDGFAWGWYQLSSPVVWFTVVIFITLNAIKRRRALNKSSKSDAEKRAAS